MVDFAGRHFRLDDLEAAAGGGDRIRQAELSLTLRLHRRHAVSLRYVLTQREVHLPGFASLARETVGVFYALADFGTP